MASLVNTLPSEEDALTYRRYSEVQSELQRKKGCYGILIRSPTLGDTKLSQVNMKRKSFYEVEMAVFV